MRRFASLFMVVAGTCLVFPGCYTYDSQTADLAILDVPSERDIPADNAVDDVPIDSGTDTQPADVASDSEDDVACSCTCEPQPCTCTCTPGGGTCEFNPNNFPEKNRLSGDPCTTNEQCVTGMCADTALVGAVWAGATIPDGMCTMLGCADDASCGDGGLCLDTAKIDPTVPRLCGKPCDADIDCRCGVDYRCVDSKIEDGNGGTFKVCLPQSLANLLSCGSATCAAEAN